MEYNTQEIRALASQVRSTGQSVSALAQNDLLQIIKGLPSVYEGDAADALNQKLDGFRRDVAALSGGLDQISWELIRFAQRIEAADRETREDIRRK